MGAVKNTRRPAENSLYEVRDHGLLSARKPLYRSSVRNLLSTWGGTTRRFRSAHGSPCTALTRPALASGFRGTAPSTRSVWRVAVETGRLSQANHKALRTPSRRTARASRMVEG